MLNVNKAGCRYFLTVLLAFFLVFAISGCSKSYDKNRDVQHYYRVVALSRSIGDLWLLSGGELAGITEDGLDLEGIGEAVSVGTVTRPGLEAILALEPDLVLVSSELSSHMEIKEKLDTAGIDTIPVTINSFDDYASVMKELTGMTGRADAYERYVTKVSERINEICRSVPDAAHGNYLAIRVSATKNKALKNDYFACDIFNDLGLLNVVQDSSGLDDLNMEWIAAADPDYIFIVLQGEEDEAVDSLKKAFTSQAVWNRLKAVRNNRTYILPKELFQYKPNDAWAGAYEYARDLIYD